MSEHEHDSPWGYPGAAELTKGTGMMAAAELSQGYLAAALEVPTHKKIVIDDKTRKMCVQPRHGACVAVRIL